LEEAMMNDPKSIVQAGSTDRKTLVEEGTEFKGSLSSNCPIIVKGRIDGDVQAPSLTVSPSGAVHGKVKVAEVRSQGEIAGEFDADLVQLSGVVKDNTIVRAKTLEVKLSPANGKLQVVFGECTLDVGEESATANTGAKPDDPVREGETPKGRRGAKGAPPAAGSEPSTLRQSAPPPPRDNGA
jgi:cytoskeletal protein CcmA (bactofilin family)